MLVLVTLFRLTYSQALAPQCAQISLYNACTTQARQRVDACGQNLKTGVPDLTYYDCQCKELTSVTTCFWYCPDSPEIMAELPDEQSNAKKWCDQAANMRLNSPATTSSQVSSPTSLSSVTTISSATPFFTGTSFGSTSTTTSNSYQPTATVDLTSSASTWNFGWELMIVPCVLIAFFVKG